jgi:hypothetical protein
MTRDQFVARLEEAGFTVHRKYKSYYYVILKWSRNNIFIKLIDNKDLFIHEQDNKQNAYFYSELDQFLIDKGIVENSFDAHEYLLSKGFKHHNILSIDCYSSDKYKIVLKTHNNIISVEAVLYNGSEWLFEGITQLSCDKAIKLIEFLNNLESE